MCDLRLITVPDAVHDHSFTYSASGATITATCSAEGCDLPESSAGAGDHVATLTIAAPADKTVNGSAKPATITDENGLQGTAVIQYQTRTGSAYGAASETAPGAAGKYKASITVGGATAFVEYALVGNQDAPAAPTAGEANIGVNGITLNTVANCEYSKDGTNWQASPAFTGLTADTEYSFYQRLKADDTHNASPASAEAKIRTLPDTLTLSVESVANTAGEAHVWRKDSGKDAVITIKDTVGDDTSWNAFDGHGYVQMDGRDLILGTDYNAAKGSTVITLKAATLQKQSVGTHEVVVGFAGGQTVRVPITVKTPASTSPDTADHRDQGLWYAVLGLSAVGVAALVALEKKRRVTGE